MNDGYRDVLQYVPDEDVRALRRAYRNAAAAAQALTAALESVHVRRGDTSVIATVGGDGRPTVIVTLTRHAARQILASYGPPSARSAPFRAA